MNAAVIISIIAVVISLISLWRSHLMPFALRVTNSDPRFTLYEITPEMSGNEEGKTWWIPSFDMGVTLHNIGQKAGTVEDLRIKAEMNGEELTFRSKFLVDYGFFSENYQDRFAWVNEGVDRSWYPILLPGKDEKTLHLVLESERWEQKKTGIINFKLEIKSDESEEWIEIEKYRVDVFEDLYDTSAVYSTKREEYRRMLEEDME